MAETHMDWLLQLIAYLKDNYGLSAEANGEIIELANDMKLEELENLSGMATRLIELQKNFAVLDEDGNSI